jgi:hypothetical protein
MSAPATPASARSVGVPPLHPDDRWSRAEFHRRHLARHDGRKWELIEGVVHMASPVRARGHGMEHALLVALLGQYSLRTPGVSAFDNATALLDDDNEPQPDAALFLAAESGGQGKLDADGYFVGAPELVAEIAGSSVSIDLGAKLQAYRRNRVQEYLVWRTEDQALDWFRWRHGAFELLAVDSNGIVRSEIFPGLWLKPAALIADDGPAALDAVLAGLASPEHAAFVADLAARRNDAGASP